MTALVPQATADPLIEVHLRGVKSTLPQDAEACDLLLNLLMVHYVAKHMEYGGCERGTVEHRRASNLAWRISREALDSALLNDDNRRRVLDLHRELERLERESDGRLCYHCLRPLKDVSTSQLEFIQLTPFPTPDSDYVAVCSRACADAVKANLPTDEGAGDA